MTHTVEYIQRLDAESHYLEAHWTIEYEHTAGAPGCHLEPEGDDEFDIVSKTLDKVVLWIPHDYGHDVAIDDMERVQGELAKFLDDDEMESACCEHWHMRGYDEELEAA